MDLNRCSRKRWGFHALFLLVTLSSVPTGQAVGDDPAAQATAARTYTVTPNSLALSLMPELKTAPAPTWVRPGLRITTFNIDGVISGSQKVLSPDEHGKWI